jgi:serine/threonine-protein kinase
LLYELVTGRPPFTGDDPMAVVSQHVHALPEPPSQHNARVPRDLEQLVLCLLAKARDERPSSADEALAVLQRSAAEA